MRPRFLTPDKDEDEGNDAEREVHHEKDRCQRTGIIDPFRLVSQWRRQTPAALLLLIFPDLRQNLPYAPFIALHELTIDQWEYILEEKDLFLRQPDGIFLERRKPLCRTVLKRIREHRQRLALTERHYHRQFGVDIRTRLMETVVIALTVFHETVAKDITAVTEECVDGGILRKAELLSHGFVLDLNDRLVVPFIGIKDP